MRPNPRWQQQGGRGQGERMRPYDPRTVTSFLLIFLFLCLFFGALRGFPRDAQYIAAAGTPRQHEADGS